tara:strand:+ start:160 stop:498 length:339 start_codon:yes stop_codon:yes gene_type:complete
MPRYNKQRKYLNDSKFYEKLKKRRGLKFITHYGTPSIQNPNYLDRATITTAGHVWKYGDRFYNLAHQYYNDSRYWWVIAWYNGYPTEADIYPGDYLDIPIDIVDALKVLGVS